LALATTTDPTSARPAWPG